MLTLPAAPAPGPAGGSAGHHPLPPRRLRRQRCFYQTRTALIAYSIGLAGLILVKVLAPAFYARQDIRTPVKFALITLTVTQLMNLGLHRPAAARRPGPSIGLASCVNAGMLYFGLRKRGIYQPQPGWALFTGKLLVAMVVLA